MKGTRDYWVDLIKLYACILVVAGHFFQSMVSSDILPGTHLYMWFNQTIYYFHVPLFFMCSGFLYQKTSTVRSLAQWKSNIGKKVLSLGVPYFFFSIITWLMKVVFADAVNIEADGLLKTLFLVPLSPYWYLYALILVFCVTLTIKSKRDATGLFVLAVAMKCVSLLHDFTQVYAVKYLLENEIWFVVGMGLCFYNVPARLKQVKTIYALLGTGLFAGLSIVVYCYLVWHSVVAFVMGLLGVFSTLSIAIKLENFFLHSKVLSYMSKYTFPIFLMHTIFAAGFRSVLFKIGVSNSVLHILFGIVISFAAPILAAIIMSKFKWIEFLLYPTKIISIGGRENVKKT